MTKGHQRRAKLRPIDGVSQTGRGIQAFSLGPILKKMEFQAQK